MGNIQGCTDAAQRLYSNVILPSSWEKRDYHGGYTFRVSIPNAKYNISGISISYPPDKNGGPEPRIIETALVGAGDELMYLDSLGYDDVCIFNSKEKLEKHLSELAQRI